MDETVDRSPKATMRHLTRCNAQFQKAVQRLPLGVACSFRYWGDDRTIYVQLARGARLWDLDKNEYIDYRLAYGPVILGYGDTRVDEAASRGIDMGGLSGLSLEAEYEVAELIAQMVPAAELVRFANSGTEAVMAALRLARSYTKRDSYIIIEGSYHGFFDAAMWRADVESWDPAKMARPQIVPYGSGIPQQARQLLHFAPLNDADMVEKILKMHGSTIGALLIEPIMGNCCSIEAAADYMRDIRKLCDDYGVLLVVDEIKTGFRIGRGGAQEHYGISADICTFAKAMANGYPIAALAGRSEIMRTINWNEVAHGGTYTAHPVALFAAAETLSIIRETDVLERIAAYGERLRQGTSEILGRYGVVHCFSGPPSMSGLLFAEVPPTNYRAWKASDFSFYNRFAAVLHDCGVLCEPDSREPWFICGAHDEVCLADTLDRFEKAVRVARGTQR